MLEVINDNEVKLEEKQCAKKLQVDFIVMESITLNIKFSLAYANHKLNFKVHRSRTYYFVKMLATMLYLKYLFTWSGRV